MISEAPLIKSLIHLNVQQTSDRMLDFLTGRIFGSTLFHLIVRPARWYQDIANEFSARSARTIRLHFQSRAEGKLEAIAQKVTDKICNEALFIEVQKIVVGSLSKDWIEGMHASESRVIPAVKLAKSIIASSIESARSYDDENPLKKTLIRNLTNLIDRQFSVVSISNPETKILIEVLVTHFFSSSPERTQNIYEALASTVNYKVKPFVQQAIKSGIYDAIPTIADGVEAFAKDNTNTLTSWLAREFCSIVSSTVLAYAGISYFSEEEIAPLTLTGSILIANIGLWGFQYLQNSSSEIDVESLCKELTIRHGKNLKIELATALADLHNRWVPRPFYCDSKYYLDSIPDDLIEKGIRLIATSVLSELKL